MKKLEFLFYFILKESDEELDIETMTDDFITFFVAGLDTTANTLAFSFLELGITPAHSNLYINYNHNHTIQK
jgi:cytochrome P450